MDVVSDGPGLKDKSFGIFQPGHFHNFHFSSPKNRRSTKKESTATSTTAAWVPLTHRVLGPVGAHQEEQLGDQQVGPQVAVDGAVVSVPGRPLAAQGGEAGGQTHHGHRDAHPADHVDQHLLHAAAKLTGSRRRRSEKKRPEECEKRGQRSEEVQFCLCFCRCSTRAPVCVCRPPCCLPVT